MKASTSTGPLVFVQDWRFAYALPHSIRRDEKEFDKKLEWEPPTE